MVLELPWPITLFDSFISSGSDRIFLLRGRQPLSLNPFCAFLMFLNVLGMYLLSKDTISSIVSVILSVCILLFSLYSNNLFCLYHSTLKDPFSCELKYSKGYQKIAIHGQDWLHNQQTLVQVDWYAHPK